MVGQLKPALLERKHAPRHPVQSAQLAWAALASNAGLLAICAVNVVLNMAAPLLLDWLKRRQGGRYRFSPAALTFNAYAIGVALGIGWAVSHGRAGLRQLCRPDMIWRFCITASLFAAGDILSFTSMQHLDPGIHSLVGKAFAMVFTVVLSRVVLGRKQTQTQYGLVGAVTMFTIVFCYEETYARGRQTLAMAGFEPRRWALGLTQRTSGVVLTSLSAILQERFMSRGPETPFMALQFWMGCGALATSFFVLNVLHSLPASQLLEGFDDWRVLLLLVTYAASGLTAGLMVKRLGAVAKGLCVPIALGGCYLYTALRGEAVLSITAVGAWAASTLLILAYGMTRVVSSRALSWTKTSRKG